MSTQPEGKLLLGYKEFFKTDPPKKRINLLKGIDKQHLIVEIAGLNYRLKPYNSKFYDLSIETQFKELYYFNGSNSQLFQQYLTLLRNYITNKEYPLIFTRPTCLYALEEIIQSELPTIKDFSMAKVEIWDSLFKYLLSVNTAITEIQEADIDDVVNFETLNPKMLPLNELTIDSDPFIIPFRAFSLFDYLSSCKEISNHFNDYIEITYNLPFEKYIYEISKIYRRKYYEDSTNDFFYKMKEIDDLQLFKALSQRHKSTDIFKLLGIRKYPFYKKDENTFILTDNIFLLDKLYDQFINDFWFDHLKKNKHWNIQKYKSIIGYFLESYVRKLIEYSFSKAKYYVIRQFEELKIHYKGNQIEIADLYIRYTSRILIGQVKSTTIYDIEKYSNDINQFYKNNREGFFNSFGVDQLVKSIKLINETIRYVDEKIPSNKRLKVFPVIIFNDKALKTPLMANVFQKRFLELMKDFQNTKVQIYPLSLIHIGDLETIQDLLNKQPGKIWELLRFHCRSPEFMPPFYNSLNRKDIKPEHKPAMEFYKKLVQKYSKEKNIG